jgi:hypothetical protein
MFDCSVVQLTISGIAHPGLGSLYGYRISARKTIIPLPENRWLPMPDPVVQSECCAVGNSRHYLSQP